MKYECSRYNCITNQGAVFVLMLLQSHLVLNPDIQVSTRKEWGCLGVCKFVPNNLKFEVSRVTSRLLLYSNRDDHFVKEQVACHQHHQSASLYFCPYPCLTLNHFAVYLEDGKTVTLGYLVPH
jgi:hypothetical protein